MKLTRFTGADSSERPSEPAYHILCDGHVSAAIAEQLDGNSVMIGSIDELSGPSGRSRLDRAGVSTVIVATRSDRQNLLAAQLARARLNPARTVVLVNAPDRIEALAEAGHEPVCATTALSTTLFREL